MTSANRNSFLGLAALLAAAAGLYLLVKGDETGGQFYDAAGVVAFTQYFLLSGALLALAFFCRAAWLHLLGNSSALAKLLYLTFFISPFLLVSMITLYAALLWLCMV
jgi:hypothetical protein